MIRRDSLLGYALLGLLHAKPLSGYDLRKIFSNTPIGTFSDSPGAIYPALERLAKQKWIRGQVEKSAGLRQRRVFRPTAAGMRAFQAWQTRPVSNEDVTHNVDELLLRFSFMGHTVSDSAARHFLRALAKELHRYIPMLHQFLKGNSRQMPLSGRLALESGIRRYETLLRWSRNALAQYEKGRKGGKRQ